MSLKTGLPKEIRSAKRSKCLPRIILEQFYSKVVLPSISYGLIIWSAGNDSHIFHSIERLHCRAAKVIYNLLKHTSSAESPGLVK